MSEKPRYEVPTGGRVVPVESEATKGERESAEAWERYGEGAETEEVMKRKAEKESAEAMEHYIEEEEKKREIALADKAIEEAEPTSGSDDRGKLVTSGKASKSFGGGTGGSRGGGSFPALGIRGSGISWGEVRFRGIARGAYNFVDRQLAKVEGIFKWLQDSLAKTSFTFLPWSNPPKVDDKPAVDPKFEKKKE